MSKEHLRPLTDAERKKGQRSRSVKKLQAARLNAVTHGKYVKHPNNVDKSILQIRMEKAFSKSGVKNGEELTRHLLSSLALTSEQLGEDITFQNSGNYTYFP